MKIIKGILIFLILTAAVYFGVSLYNKYQDNKNHLAISEQNSVYYQDSLRTERNHVGELVYQHAVLMATNANLTKLNSELESELKKERGNVIYFSKINASLMQEIYDLKNRPDTNFISVIINSDFTQTIVFQYDTIFSKGNSRHLLGAIKVGFKNDKFLTYTFFSEDTQDSVEIKIPLIDENAVSVNIPRDSISMTMFTGLKENEETGLLEIFVRSNFPGFVVTELDGALIDPHESALLKSYFRTQKPKHWGLGVTVGIGTTLSDKQLWVGPSASLGVTYMIWYPSLKKSNK